MTRGLACVSAALLLLSACTVGPKYQRPQTPVAPGFSEAPPQSFTESAGWKQAQPADQTLRADWWRLFNNDELNGLEDQVNASNQSLQAADAQYRQARALIQINRAGLFPTHFHRALRQHQPVFEHGDDARRRLRAIQSAARYQLRVGRLGPHSPLHHRRARRGAGHRRRYRNHPPQPARRIGVGLFRAAQPGCAEGSSR